MESACAVGRCSSRGLPAAAAGPMGAGAEVGGVAVTGAAASPEKSCCDSRAPLRAAMSVIGVCAPRPAPRGRAPPCVGNNLVAVVVMSLPRGGCWWLLLLLLLKLSPPRAVVVENEARGNSDPAPSMRAAAPAAGGVGLRRRDIMLSPSPETPALGVSPLGPAKEMAAPNLNGLPIVQTARERDGDAHHGERLQMKARLGAIAALQHGIVPPLTTASAVMQPPSPPVSCS